MAASTIPAILALVASIVLYPKSSLKLFAILAIVASGLEVLMAFHVLRLSVARLPLILGAVLVVSGLILYTRVSAKIAIACATVVAVVGAMQVLATL